MKTRHNILLLICLLTFGFSGGAVFSAEQIYGSQLMTQQERQEHRAKMQSMHTMEEREQYRMEHHDMMQERAKQQGITLPDEAPMHNNGMGSGQGRGMGGGQGGGMGR